MESSDVFSQGVQVSDADPFAGGDDWAAFGDAAQEPVEEPPVVDREGVAVTPTLSPEAAAAEAQAYRTEKGEPEPPEPVVAAPEEPERFVPGVQAPVAAHGAPSAPEPVVEAPVPPAPARGATVPPPALPGGVHVSQTLEPELAPEVTDGDEDEAEDAPVPQEPVNEAGRPTHRRYYVFRATDTGTYEQLSWNEKDGKMVPKGTHGAKRQSVALARGTEDALKIGYAALGSPLDGVKIVAVAALHFQVRTVKPRVPEPSRARLEIS